MKIIDPIDGKTPYDTVRAAVKHWTGMLGAELLGAVIDNMAADLYKRPDLANATQNVPITGTGVRQTVNHNCKDADGKPAKPRAWSIIKFKGCTEIDVVAMDDTTLTVEITNKGEATIALFI